MRIAALVLATCFCAAAQTSGSIQASGSATVTAKPDQATLSIGVMTQGASAQEAADRNATLADAVINAIDKLLNGAGTVQTISYSLYARYNNTGSDIVGWVATNTVQVVTTNLNLVGPLIDTANKAGANQIGGPAFGLQNSEPQRQQALAAASKQALAHAAAIASGLGVKTGAILSAQEGVTATPINTVGGAAAGSGTPIQTGTVSVTATVTISVALVQ